MRAGVFAGQRHAGVRRALEAARKVSPVGTVQRGRPQGFPFESRTTSLDDFEGYAGSLHWSGLFWVPLDRGSRLRNRRGFAVSRRGMVRPHFPPGKE